MKDIQLDDLRQVTGGLTDEELAWAKFYAGFGPYYPNGGPELGPVDPTPFGG